MYFLDRVHNLDYLLLDVDRCAGQPEEDLADEEEGASDGADLSDVEVDATGQGELYLGSGSGFLSIGFGSRH